MARGGCGIERRRGDSWGLIIGFIALIFAANLFGQTDQGRSMTAPGGSSYGFGESHLSGIYTVLDKQGVARRWQLPFERLDDRVDRLVIWDTGNVPDAHWTALLDWVKQGHTAILGGPLTNLPEQVLPTGAPAARPVAAHGAALGLAQLETGGGHFAALPPERLVHLADPAGRPVLVTWPVGEGRIYWSADTAWLANGRIARGENLDYALALLYPAAGKQVAFDEYHHGYQSATRWWQLLRGPLQGYLIALAIACALLFWTYGSRFGSPRPTPPGPPRAAVEYVTSMSQLYRRARARQIVLQALYRSLTRSLGRLLGGTRGLSHGEIGARLGPQAGLKGAAIESLLDRLGPDSHKLNPSDAELIRLARETEDLQRRMQHGRFRDQRNPSEGADRT